MDEAKIKTGLEVGYGNIFLKSLQNFPYDDQLKIASFAVHLEQHGFIGLPGRNKSSIDIDKDDGNFMAKVDYVKQNKLHHYHIGIPHYDKTNDHGDWTSEYILHYQKFDNFVVIVDLDHHPPFNLPAEKYLKIG